MILQQQQKKIKENKRKKETHCWALVVPHHIQLCVCVVLSTDDSCRFMLFFCLFLFYFYLFF
jgi:hypothetical protein